jgi:cob(I)alamin adenosyltransferase
VKIYTKTGDKGKTALFGGKRVPKDAPRIEVCGTIDELSSMIGVCRSANSVKAIDAILAEIQTDLFSLGTDLAAPRGKLKIGIKRLDKSSLTRVERHIDTLEIKLDSLRNFILPGGNKCASLIHLSRAVCRRAERLLVRLARRESVGEIPLAYLNRLSDLLFVLARWSNALSSTPEEKWISG